MILTIAGGDERMLTVAERLKDDGHEVRLFALGRDLNGASVNEKADIADYFGNSDAIILPMPAFKKGYLNSPYVGEIYTVDEILKNADGRLVLGGMLPKRPDQKFMIDYAESESLLAENAYLTAEGALAVLINSTPFAIRNANILVAGYGRIGKRISNMLKSLGGRVCVAARGEEKRAEIAAKGFSVAGFEDIEARLRTADAVINTVPCRVFGRKELLACRKGAVFLELASSPGGADGDDCKELGIKYINAPGLPGKTAPITAGEAIYREIKSILRAK